jgi:hypothetical protein
MAVRINAAAVRFADDTTQNTPASLSPAWANITGRPGDYSNAPWSYSSTAGGIPQSRNAGATGNCGPNLITYTSYFKLHPTPTTTPASWDMYYNTINCTDCNCACNC